MGKKKLARFFLVSVGIIFGVLFVSSVCYAQIPQTINYQGYLTDAEGYPLNGTVDMVFTLYDVDTGGSLLWTETQTGVVVTEGIFSVNLGAVTPLSLPFDTPYWLGVTVGTDLEMTPRQPITSVGYAVRAAFANAVAAGGVESYMLADDAVTADKIDDGAVGSAHLGLGAVTTDKLHNNAVTSAKILNNSVTYDDIVDGTGSLLDADKLDGLEASDFMLAGVDNWVDETGDTMTGTLEISVSSGHGLSSTSSSGHGVYGYATASSGPAFGVWGQTASTSGRGVYGYTTASTGTTTGVYGISNSTSGRGIYGQANALTGTAYGVIGYSASTSGRGVYGEATASTGTTYGVIGQSGSTSGSGVYGIATASSGINNGVYGRSMSTSGKAVYGYATADTGTTYGVYGRSSSPDGYGGYFYAPSTNGIGIFAYGGSSGYAADFRGNVRIRERISGDTVMELGIGLDYAEGFDVAHKKEISPGSVLIIDPDNPGKLTVGGKPYDTKVAGIVAGANGTGSGVRLGAGQFDYDVALAGRVYCNVDATEVGVEPGDLLTTSATPGYAMKATDYGRAQGAILGKAMQKLEKGQKGQILVLVTLQ